MSSREYLAWDLNVICLYYACSNAKILTSRNKHYIQCWVLLFSKTLIMFYMVKNLIQQNLCFIPLSIKLSTLLRRVKLSWLCVFTQFDTFHNFSPAHIHFHTEYIFTILWVVYISYCWIVIPVFRITTVDHN